MCLSGSNIQLSGVLLQLFLEAMKMHCQPRLVCAVDLLGEEPSEFKQRSLKKDTHARRKKHGAAHTSTSSLHDSIKTSAQAQQSP